MTDTTRTLPTTMHAYVQDGYVQPEGLEYREVPLPELDDDRVLIRVGAASINPYDYYMMTGVPYLVRMRGLRRPAHPIPGADVAGTVVAVGRNVDGFAVGDRVFGGSPGSFASYTAARADRVVHTPDDVSDEHAATVAIAGGTAYQAVVDIAKVGPGQSVLVTGASGGVGSYAVQIAKARGARVTAVCSTRNVEWVRDLGADHVIDYRKQDVTTITERFDAIIDNVATAPMRAMRRLLEPGGTYVVVGTVKKGRWIAAFLPLIRAKLVGMRGDKTMRGMLAESSPDTLNALGALLASGEVVPRIDRRFSLSEVPDAFRHQADGHAQGKSIIVP